MSNKATWKEKQNQIQELIDTIKARLKPETFASWFKDTKFTIDNNILIVNTPNTFAKDYISKKYYNLIKEISQLEVKIICKSWEENQLKFVQADIQENQPKQESKEDKNQSKNETASFQKSTHSKNIEKELINKKRTSSFSNNEKEPELEEIDLTNVFRDIDKSAINASIPRQIYFDKIKSDFKSLNTKYNKGKLTKVDLLVYMALCFKVNNQEGIVKNTTITDIAKFIHHSSHSKVTNSIKNLKALGLIDIIKNARPYKYIIIGYNEATQEDSKGFVSITYNMFKELTKASLRQIRGVFWLINHRYHLELKNIQFAPNLSSLKEVMNARSLREVIELLSALEGKIFKLIDKLKDVKRLSPFDKLQSKLDKLNPSNKLASVFNKKDLGIGSFVKPTKEIVKTVKETLLDIEVPTTKDNIRKAVGLATMVPDWIVYEAKKICSQEDIKSEHKTVGFYTGLLQKLYNN